MGKTKRNHDILKSYQGEIDLRTKSVKSKKQYSRKNKSNNYDKSSE